MVTSGAYSCDVKVFYFILDRRRLGQRTTEKESGSVRRELTVVLFKEMEPRGEISDYIQIAGLSSDEKEEKGERASGHEEFDSDRLRRKGEDPYRHNKYLKFLRNSNCQDRGVRWKKMNKKEIGERERRRHLVCGALIAGYEVCAFPQPLLYSRLRVASPPLYFTVLFYSCYFI